MNIIPGEPRPYVPYTSRGTETNNRNLKFLKLNLRIALLAEKVNSLYHNKSTVLRKEAILTMWSQKQSLESGFPVTIFIFLLICSLFKDTVILSHYMASNVRMVN
jgi:hypothetical protein